MPVKKASKKPLIKKKNPIKPKIKASLVAKVKKEKEIGRVTHYFSEIKVAVIKFKQPVKIGDSIRVTGGEETDFKQKIASMQVDHKKTNVAKKGQEVGLKVKEKAREGYKVFKV